MTLSSIHVTGSLTISGTAYPFDEQLTSGNPVPFTNAGVTYHLQQTILGLTGSIGLWIDSSITPLPALSIQLSAVIDAYVPLLDPVINYGATSVSTFTDADVLQDGVVLLPQRLHIVAPWIANPFTMPAPLPSISYGLGINSVTLASGLLLGFRPEFSSWSTVHQSPITMMQFKYPS